MRCVPLGSTNGSQVYSYCWTVHAVLEKSLVSHFFQKQVRKISVMAYLWGLLLGLFPAKSLHLIYPGSAATKLKKAMPQGAGLWTIGGVRQVSFINNDYSIISFLRKLWTTMYRYFTPCINCLCVLYILHTLMYFFDIRIYCILYWCKYFARHGSNFKST